MASPDRKSVAFNVSASGISGESSGDSHKSASNSRKSVTFCTADETSARESARNSTANAEDDEGQEGGAENRAAANVDRWSIIRSRMSSRDKSKDEGKQGEDLSRSLTMAAKKARGDQPSLLMEGMARTLSLRPGSARPRAPPAAELSAEAIEAEVATICGRWGVGYIPSPDIESPEELLERHRALRAECAERKQRHCNALLAERKARVSSAAGLGAGLDGHVVQVVSVERRGREAWGLLVHAVGGKGNLAVEAHLLKRIEVATVAGTEETPAGAHEAPRSGPGCFSNIRIESGAEIDMPAELTRADPSFARAGPSFVPGGRSANTSTPPMMAQWAMGVSSVLGFGSSPRSPPPPPSFEATDQNAHMFVRAAALSHADTAPSTKLLKKIKGGALLFRRLRHSLRAVPAMPMPVALSDVFLTASPRDASCLERWRDRILAFFAQPTVSKIFLGLALVVVVCVVGFGLIIAWAILGLFLHVPNGWDEWKPECLALFRLYNQTYGPQSVPKPPNAEWGWSQYSTVEDCTMNQMWFNRCIKAFTILFSYINFLPIPWRLAILHHVTCSKRACEPGCDFYGNKTDALWFNLPTKTRFHISVLLNLAWIFHFWSLAMHLVWQSYVEGQTWPGAFWQNFPFVLSILFAVGGGVMQGKAEDAVVKARPDLYPPKLQTYINIAVSKWWSQKRANGFKCGFCCVLAPGEIPFLEILRAEMAEFKEKTQELAAKGLVPGTNALTGCDGIAATGKQTV